MRESQTEVLVVGAGPVGLWTAVLLAEAGVEVAVIDREERTTTRSYACAIHPRTLRLLEKAQLLEPVLDQGRQIQKLVFYDEHTRRIEVPLASVDREFPFLVILPQSALEGALEERLRKAGVRVLWNHRFDSLADETEMVSSTVEQLGGTGTGYIVPHWEMVVKDRAALLSQFVVGADGYNSRVRQGLGIQYEQFAGPVSFAAFEFETDEALEPELRVILGSTTNVLWPMAGQKCRWTFQIIRSELERDFPEKERRSARFSQTQVDERIRAYVQKIAGERAPWFKGTVKEIAWCTEVSFEQRLARQFGRGRCWLAGDAAHQTGPAGVQSMNAGFAEAEMLTTLLSKVLRQQESLESVTRYDREQQANWLRLLGRSGEFKPKAQTDAWVRANVARILPCLPASGRDVLQFASQLQLDFS